MALRKLNEFLNSLTEVMFQAEYRRLATAIDRLVEQNDEIRKDPTKGFMFAGEVYRHSTSNTIHKPWPMLAWSLNEEMEGWLKDSRAISLDRAQISQMLFKLTYMANDLQELRDTLPECLVSLVPQFSEMPRKFNQEFLIRHSPRDMKQFKKLLPKIELYAMTKLIY